MFSIKNNVFFKGVDKQELKQKRKNEILLREIIQAKRRLDTALNNFNFAHSDDLVDIYTYEIMVAKSQYDYLCKKAKMCQNMPPIQSVK